MIKTIEKFCYEKRLRFGYGTDAGMEDFFGVTPNGVFVILDRPRVGLTEGEVVLRGNAVQYRDELAAMLGRNGNEVTKVSDNRLHVVFRNVRIMSCGYNDIPNFPKYLCFKAGSGGGTVSMVSDLATKPNLQYSVDQIVWYDLTVDSAGGDSDVLDLAADEKVYLRGTNHAFSDGGSNHSTFILTGTIYASGNINTILFNSDLDDYQLHSYSFYRLFFGQTSLMTMPEMPSTKLSNDCYTLMYYGCTGLTKTTVLPAKTIDTRSYNRMFQYCSNLAEVTCLATDISATNSTIYWLDTVAASGTFYKDSTMTNWTTGNSGIPSGWTVEDYTE